MTHTWLMFLRSRQCKSLLWVMPLIMGSTPWVVSQAEPRAVAAVEMPVGGQVISGSVVIEQSGNVVTLRQSSDRAIVTWQRFDVSPGGVVEFQHPNKDASTLNRITGRDASLINGAVSANGRVLIENPQGIMFGAEAEVKTAGLVATTLRVADVDYLSGSNRLNVAGPVRGRSLRAPQIVNRENLEVTDLNGYIALMAPEVINEGVLIAKLRGKNTTALITGEKVTLTFAGKQLTDVTVDGSVVNALISRKRLIYTEGGYVIIAAHSVSDLRASVIRAPDEKAETVLTKKDGDITSGDNRRASNDMKFATYGQ